MNRTVVIHNLPLPAVFDHPAIPCLIGTDESDIAAHCTIAHTVEVWTADGELETFPGRKLQIDCTIEVGSVDSTIQDLLELGLTVEQFELQLLSGMTYEEGDGEYQAVFLFELK